jgi:hypothetical protein
MNSLRPEDNPLERSSLPEQATLKAKHPAVTPLTPRSPVLLVLGSRVVDGGRRERPTYDGSEFEARRLLLNRLKVLKAALRRMDEVGAKQPKAPRLVYIDGSRRFDKRNIRDFDRR